MNGRPSKEPDYFRPEALAAANQEEPCPDSLRVAPPWAWKLFWTLAALALAALALLGFGRVEVQRPGRGILRPVHGVRLLKAEVAGTLAQVHGRSGEPLRAGDPVVRIQVAQSQVSLLEAERQLDLLRSCGSRFSAEEDQLMRAQEAAAQERAHRQRSLVTSHEGSLEIMGRQVDAAARLHAEGLIAETDLQNARERLHAAARQLDMARQQLTQLHQERMALAASRERARFVHLQALGSASARREALEATLRQSEIRAPADGYLDALTARAGDLVQAGQTVAKLLPAGSPLEVVAFLPEKDRAGLQPGDLARLALDAYPAFEFGSLQGRIRRIGSDLASPDEIREALGEETRLATPVYRVELEVLPGRPRRLEQLALRPGMLLEARFVVRRQRVLGLLLDPLGRWAR